MHIAFFFLFFFTWFSVAVAFSLGSLLPVVTVGFFPLGKGMVKGFIASKHTLQRLLGYALQRKKIQKKRRVYFNNKTQRFKVQQCQLTQLLITISNRVSYTKAVMLGGVSTREQVLCSKYYSKIPQINVLSYLFLLVPARLLQSLGLWTVNTACSVFNSCKQSRFAVLLHQLELEQKCFSCGSKSAAASSHWTEFEPGGPISELLGMPLLGWHQFHSNGSSRSVDSKSDSHRKSFKNNWLCMEIILCYIDIMLCIISEQVCYLVKHFEIQR